MSHSQGSTQTCRDEFTDFGVQSVIYWRGDQQTAFLAFVTITGSKEFSIGHSANRLQRRRNMCLFSVVFVRM
jgi:hypothetical protein